MNNINTDMADVIYETLCISLDTMGITYKKLEAERVVLFGHMGDDMEHELVLAVDDRHELIRITERLPFAVNPANAASVAAGVCYANSRISVGAFNYNMDSLLTFEISHIYSGSLVGDETVKRLILSLVYAVEAYDDKLMALSNGCLQPEDLLN